MEKELWYGSEASLKRVLEIEEQIKNAPESLVTKLSEEWETEEDKEDHWLLTMFNSVAVITLSGPMVPGSVGYWGSYFGYVGYDDIKEAFACGIAKGATEFLLDWDTPGGSTKGMEDVSYYLEQVAEQYPVTSFTSNMVASAGLWLATTADEFYATPMSQIGSIGVVATHTEYSEMLKMDGITKTVFRSTPLKALGSPYEKLSPEAEAFIRNDLAQAHEFFVDAITRHTGLPRVFVSETLATGEIWYAAEAMEKGLLTGIKTFDEILVALLDKSVENTNDYKTSPLSYSIGNAPEVSMKRKVITPEAVAAIASGVSPEAALADAPLEEETPTPEASADAPLEEETPTPTPEASVIATQPDFMNQLVDARVKLGATEAKLSALEATTDGLKEIVACAIQRAFAGVGSPVPDKASLLAMDASLLIQQFSAADAQLQKRFPVGGRVSQQASEEQDEDVALAAVANLNSAILQNLATFKPTKTS